jgi:lactate permease
VLLGVLKIKAWIAGLVSLAVALVVAVVVYSMPVGQALLSASDGATFGFFPIFWIVLNAIWVYNLTVAGDHSAHSTQQHLRSYLGSTWSRSGHVYPGVL